MLLNLFKDNIEALNLLDWSQITTDISSLSHFEITQKYITHSPKILAHDTIQKKLNLLESYILKFDDYSYIFNVNMRMLPTEESKFHLIRDLEKGKYFEASELNFFALLVENYIATYSSMSDLQLESSFEISKENISSVRRGYLNPLREFIDKNGMISYESHPLLKKLYSEITAIEQELRSSIIRISKSEPYASKLQMENFDIVNDRYVLAIRSDSYNSNLGLIVARSQSGMTLFVEPFEMREKSNRRMQMLSEIESIILKLTIDLSKIAFTFQDTFKTISTFVLEIDLINTKATYSIKLGLTKPHLNSKFLIDLKGCFHPLIVNPVKNSLELKTSHKGLIISGPNTGGKTVALKSLSITYLFLNLGLFVPASYADLCPIEGLFYFSHDHQNLKLGLSSFASESKYYLQLLEQLESKNLIIIDEIFNSTSSEEASALAMAFLDEIHHRSNSKVIISTHHQILKTFMHSNTEYISAHVGFDFEINKPTYKLITGEPGSSLAFKIFENLSSQYGLQTKISDRAREFLDHKQVTYENLLQELSSKKIEVDKIIIQNKQLNADLKNQKSSMEGILFLEKEKIYSVYSSKIKKLFNQAEGLLVKLNEEKITTKKNLVNEIVQIQKELNNHASVRALPKEQVEIYDHLIPINLDDVKISMNLFSITLRKNILVINVNPRRNEIQIQNGALSLWVSPKTLRYPSGTKPLKQKVIVNIERSIRGDIEIDCRGNRLEEFQKTCEQALEEVISGDVPFVTIIHGHGDGILKNWLREHLRKNHRELKWQNIEGNDGCTKISLS